MISYILFPFSIIVLHPLIIIIVLYSMSIPFLLFFLFSPVRCNMVESMVCVVCSEVREWCMAMEHDGEGWQWVSPDTNSFWFI